MPHVQSIAVLGSTGSVGTSCLDVIRSHPDRMRAVGLSAYRSVGELRQQVAEFHPDWAVLGPEADGDVREPGNPDRSGCTDWYRDLEVIPQLVRQANIDTVLSAVVGAAGLPAALAAVDAGKRLAIANKETMVIAGSLIVERAEETGAQVLPVDSEHCAIFQCLQSGRRQDVRRIILTASGGPFRGWTREQMTGVTPAMALRHPTWKMGRKITVDSATMMNKALEIVEARWLFGIPADRIMVMIHPQSQIHSLVEYLDGSVISQISPPDMRLPIQYAFTYPERLECPARGADWQVPLTLELLPPDLEAFPALRLGFEVARQGGTCGAVLNAANEVAVARFLSGELRFDQITQVVEEVLHHHRFEARPTLDQLMRLDDWSRKEAIQWKT